MRVLKITAEGLTTSFRYPHFMQQIHPTFQMPPPATIYGHICSALGEWVDPTGLKFAYHFTFKGETRDIEHIILLKRAAPTAKLPGTRIPNVLEGKVNPFERHLLFQPRLVLYLNRPEWEAAFRSPRYTVVLGRSQDLFTYTDVNIVELEQAHSAYFEHTLVPFEMATRVPRGITVLMPRFLDYTNGRRPTYSRYVIIRDRVYTQSDFIHFSDQPSPHYWIDPTTPEAKGCHMGLAFLSFVGEDSETIQLA